MALRVHPAAHGYVFLSYFYLIYLSPWFHSFQLLLLFEFFVLENEWKVDSCFFLILSYSFIGFAIIFMKMGIILR